jgi:hypothetical protein
MHGPNFTRLAPELIDGEEEYSIKKILDSRRFGRRQRLQYLVKWEGYPDSENMWINKDNVFTDDKVWEFKASYPSQEVHLKGAQVIDTPQPHIHIPHVNHHTLTTKPMSSNGHSNLTDKYPAGAIADDVVPFVAMAADLAEALRSFPGFVPGRVSPDFVLQQICKTPPPLELSNPRLEVAGNRMES